MFSTLSSYNPIGKTLFALEHAVKDNTLLILGLEIQSKKGELDIIQSFTADSIPDTFKFTKGGQQITLAITDNNVLTKEVQNTGTDLEIISEAYPNLNPDDFYYQILKTATKSFVAISRKQHIDHIVENYQKEKVVVSEVSLGNLKMAALSSYLKSDEILNYTSIVKFENQEVSSISSKENKDEQNYELEGLTFSSKYSLPLALALGSFSNQTKITGNVDQKNRQLQLQHKESAFFKKTLQYGIGFLLITLLINFFVFNAKYKTWQTLQEEIQVYTSQNETIKKRQAVVSAKETVVNSILTTGFSKSSFYIDQVVQVLPSTVSLNSFIYQPNDKTIREDKTISIKNDVVQVTGESMDKANFTAWLNTVENLDFVAAVTIANYGINKENTLSFEILINLANDTAK